MNKKSFSKKNISLSIFLASIFFSCSVQNININQEEFTNTENITEKSKISFSTLDFKVYGEKEDKKDKNNEKEDIKSWQKMEQKKHDKLKITSITIDGTNKRVDEAGTDSIKPDYAGGSLILSIKGNFHDDIIKRKDYTFTNEPNLLQISYVGEKSPKTKALMNDSTLLTITSATKTEIKVKIDFTAIPDFYLKGLHKISILDEDDKRTDAKIRIGDPEIPKVSLSPSIEEVKIIKVKDIFYDKDSKEWAFNVAHEDDEKDKLEDFLKTWKNLPNTGINLKIKGKNFMMFYKFAYSKIDGRHGFCHSTAISKDANGNVVWEAIVHIPDIKDFNTKTKHTISYSTPFGTTIRGF